MVHGPPSPQQTFADICPRASHRGFRTAHRILAPCPQSLLVVPDDVRVNYVPAFSHGPGCAGLRLGSSLWEAKASRQGLEAGPKGAQCREEVCPWPAAWRDGQPGAVSWTRREAQPHATAQGRSHPTLCGSACPPSPGVQPLLPPPSVILRDQPAHSGHQEDSLHAQEQEGNSVRRLSRQRARHAHRRHQGALVDQRPCPVLQAGAVPAPPRRHTLLPPPSELPRE